MLTFLMYLVSEKSCNHFSGGPTYRRYAPPKGQNAHLWAFCPNIMSVSLVNFSAKLWTCICYYIYIYIYIYIYCVRYAP